MNTPFPNPGLPDLTPRVIIQNGINIFLVIIGIMAVLMIAVSAAQIITAGGSADKVKKARQNLMWGIVGLLIAMAAGLIVNIVIGIAS